MPIHDSKSEMISLTKNMRSLSFRRSFKVDPINTLSNVGIDTKGIDRKVVDSLAALSPQELDSLSALQEKFEGSEDLAEFTGGIIF